MRLAHLALGSMVGCLIGLVALIAAALFGLHHLDERRAETQTLIPLQQRVDDFLATNHSLLLHSPDSALWQAYLTEAHAIQAELETLSRDHPAATRAAARIDELVTALANVRAEASETDVTATVEPIDIPLRARIAINRIARLDSAIANAFDEIIATEQAARNREATWVAGSLVGAGLLFALFCLSAFTMIYRRVHGPLLDLAAGIARIQSGARDVRVAATGGDEIADLGHAVNDMLDRRDEDEERLHHYRELVENSRDMFAVVDDGYRCRLANRAYADLYGFAGPEALEGRHLREVVGIDFFEREVRGPIDRCLAGETVVFEAERTYPQHGTRWLRVQYQPLSGSDGTTRRIAVVTTDLTDLRVAEAEQRRMHERLQQYRKLVEATNDLCVIVDRDYRYVLVNRAYAERYGMAVSEIEGMHGRDVVGADFHERVTRPRIDRAFVGLPQQFEAERDHPRLGRRQLLIRYFPLTDADGQIHQVAAVITDISDLHHAREQLRRSTHKLRHSARELRHELDTRQALLNSLPAFIALLDGDGCIIDINERWREHNHTFAPGETGVAVGGDYVAHCRRPSGPFGAQAEAAADGLQAVLDGRHDRFSLDYPDHRRGTWRWFRMMANRLTPGEGTQQRRGAVVMHLDITERKRAELELGRLAFEDPTTGLLTRNGFVTQLNERLRSGAWSASDLVILIDLEALRHVNDAHGYSMGDRLLHAIGQRLTAHAGNGGLVGRIGGDEFVVYRPTERACSARSAFDALDEAVFHRPYTIADARIEVSARFGSTRAGDEARDAEALLHEAELALFETRAHGEGHRATFSRELEVEARRRVALTRDLRHALDENQFELHYQPKVDLRSATMVGAEALLRWRQPERGLQPPGAFIPIAERSQLMGPIGDWALFEACRQLRAWRDAGLVVPRVAVNVSVVQFRLSHFIDHVRAALDRHGVDAQALTLEITESVFEEESTMLRRELRALHDLGVRLSLDDFGTGYSSLLYLQQYPFDEIKIDQGFVQNVLNDRYSREIVTTVLGIVGALGADAVAEGIETAAVRDELLAMGCWFGQGYFYSMPLAADDFLALMANGTPLPPSSER